MLLGLTWTGCVDELFCRNCRPSTLNSPLESLRDLLDVGQCQDAERSVAAPFVLIEPPAVCALNYYTLSASVVDAGAFPDAIAKKLPRYPQLPVALLGRLAVDQSVTGRGVGQLLLMDALHLSLSAAASIAALAVLVDAKDDAAVAFYQHFSFLPLQRQPRRLFLPMKTIYRRLGN